MFRIESNKLSVSIRAKGAELTSVINKENGLEYMWDANPDFWAKRSPVLFPIVGALKDNTYIYKNKEYTLPRHGFARDMEFVVTKQNPDSITFSISDDETTRNVYPFHFGFSIEYKLEGDELAVKYIVNNKESMDNMYCSVGGHPAFKVPLTEGANYEDYVLLFEQEETTGRWPITKEGLIESTPESLLNGTNTLPLSKELFLKDALVFKDLKSESVRLQSSKTEHGLAFRFRGFPYLGLWAAPGADFVCIEPWCGIADSVDTDQQLQNKEGIISLPPGEKFAAVWEVKFF